MYIKIKIRNTNLFLFFTVLTYFSNAGGKTQAKTLNYFVRCLRWEKEYHLSASSVLIAKINDLAVLRQNKWRRDMRSKSAGR